MAPRSKTTEEHSRWGPGRPSSDCAVNEKRVFPGLLTIAHLICSALNDHISAWRVVPESLGSSRHQRRLLTHSLHFGFGRPLLRHVKFSSDRKFVLLKGTMRSQSWKWRAPGRAAFAGVGVTRAQFGADSDEVVFVS